MEPRDEHDDDVDNESESSADGTRRGRGMRRDVNVGTCVVSKGAGAHGGGVGRGACPVENDEQRLRSFFQRCDSVLFHAPKSETWQKIPWIKN